MNTPVLIIGLLIIAAFILMATVLSGGLNRTKKLLVKELRSYARANGITISESDSWDKSAIGTNDTNDTIVFLDANSAERFFTKFSIRDVKSVNTIPDVSGKAGKRINFNLEPRLCLNFTFKDPSVNPLVIYFYREDFGIINDEDMQRFLKWSDIASRSLKSK